MHNNSELESSKFTDMLGVPTIPELAQIAPASFRLMAELVSGFESCVKELNTGKSYWIALNAWISNTLSERIMSEDISEQEMREFIWAAYASSYWGGIELRENWGMPPAMERLGMVFEPPFTESLQGFVATLMPRLSVLAAGNSKCLAYVPDLLHEDLNAGAIWNTAYNAGCQVIKTEDAPIGQRRPHRRQQPSMVRINARDFMRVDYELPSPKYLRVLRSAFECAVKSEPEAFEKIIVGEAGQKNLRQIWSEGIEFGNKSWGQGANDPWSNEYFDDTLHWSTVLNFGLEAVSLGSLVSAINNDGDLARRAVMGNAMYAGMPTGWLLGMLNVNGELPEHIRN